MEIKLDGKDVSPKYVTFSEMEVDKFYRFVVFGEVECDSTDQSFYARISADILLEFHPGKTIPTSVGHVGRYVLETCPVTITIKS